MQTRTYSAVRHGWGEYSDLGQNVEAVCVKAERVEVYVFKNSNGDIGVNVFEEGKKVVSYRDFEKDTEEEEE